MFWREMIFSMMFIHLSKRQVGTSSFFEKAFLFGFFRKRKLAVVDDVLTSQDCQSDTPLKSL